MNNDSQLLTTHSLTKTYQDGHDTVEVLKGIDLAIETNSMNAIIGSSGSGKSTLLHILGGLDSPTSGNIYFKGREIQSLSEKEKAIFRNQEVGFIYQFHHLLGDFSALENVAMPLLIGGYSPKEAQQKAAQMLEKVNLAHRHKHRSSELSGGERQRVAIARALVNNPSLVLADEPTGNLDQENANGILDLLFKLNQELGTAFIVVTHDLSLASKMGNQYRMNNGLLSSALTSSSN